MLSFIADIKVMEEVLEVANTRRQLAQKTRQSVDLQAVEHTVHGRSYILVNMETGVRYTVDYLNRR